MVCWWAISHVGNGLIKPSGGGRLIQPDGARQLVRFSAEISIADRATRLIVRGRGDLEPPEGKPEPGPGWADDPRTLIRPAGR